MIAAGQKAAMIVEANFRDLHHRLTAIFWFDVVAGGFFPPKHSPPSPLIARTSFGKTGTKYAASWKNELPLPIGKPVVTFIVTGVQKFRGFLCLPYLN
jgi:hypothetical protein